MLNNVPIELTVEERGMLLNIRKKKMELLHEISQLKDELTEVNTEIEAMDTEEGYVSIMNDLWMLRVQLFMPMNVLLQKSNFMS